MIIKKIENISEILKKIIEEILDKYIPSFEVVSTFINNEALDKFLEEVKAIMNKTINILDEKIKPILNIIKKINKLNKNGLINFILDEIKIPINSGKITEIMKTISIIKNDYININENNANEILIKIDGIIESIYDLDEEINEKEEGLLEQILVPVEEIINKINNITNKIELEINNIISTLMTELENAEEKIKNLLDKIIQQGKNLIPKKKIKKGLNKVLQKGDKYFNKTKEILEKVIKKPGLIKTFQSLQKGMNDYEKSSQMDETINILNDCIIDQLFDLLCQALQNSKIGDLIAKGAKALLREMRSSKKNLRAELKGIGALPEKENATSLNSQSVLKENSKNNNSRNKNNFSKIKDAFSKLMSIIENVINNIFKKNFKFPEGTNTIIYINLKFGENPFKKILIKELEISLSKLKEIIQILNDFLKKIIKFLKGEENAIDSFRSLFDEFSNNSFLKIKEGLSESIQNIKIGLISLIKDLILGKSKSTKFDGVILTWTDYFIKGIKICSTIDEAQTLSESLIENGIISIDGELNKEKILEIKDLKQIKIKKFPLKLNIDLKEDYQNLKSKIKQKISGSIPNDKILKIIEDLENDITLRIKEENEKITENYTNIIEKGTNFVLEKENECKQLIKKEMNFFMEKCIKEITNILQKEKNIIEKGSNVISNEINELSNSIEERINKFEDIINNKIKEIENILINKVFGNLELIENLKKKINLNKIIDNIDKASENIDGLVLGSVKKYITKINQLLSLYQDLTKTNDLVLSELNEKIINSFKPFSFKFKNAIIPVIDIIRKIKIDFSKIDPNKFIIEKARIPINSLMNDIKERNSQLTNIIKNNINDKKEEILNNIDSLKDLLNKIYFDIVEKENIILDKLFEPCDNFIHNLKTTSDEIQTKIDNVILNNILPYIQEYREKITNYCFNEISKLCNKIDNYGNNLLDNAQNKINIVNTQLMKNEQKLVDTAEKGFSKVKDIFKKIDIKKADTLLKEFKSLYEDINDYNESECNEEIISKLCDTIKKELKTMIRDCIKESELCKYLNIDESSLFKELSLN